MTDQQTVRVEGLEYTYNVQGMLFSASHEVVIHISYAHHRSVMAGSIHWFAIFQNTDFGGPPCVRRSTDICQKPNCG